MIVVVLAVGLYWLNLPGPKKTGTEMQAETGEPDPGCNTSQSFLAGNCSQYLSTGLVTREEWVTLFPEADFYLVETRRIENYETVINGFVQENFIIIQQGEQEYRDITFDKLLHDNQIIIGNENIELVLRAFAWITAANYLKEDLSFSALQEVSFTENQARHPYNFQLSAVTEFDNIQLNWYFVMENNRLRIVTYQSPAPLREYFFSP
jgi:hypothetical protein